MRVRLRSKDSFVKAGLRRAMGVEKAFEQLTVQFCPVRQNCVKGLVDRGQLGLGYTFRDLYISFCEIRLSAGQGPRRLPTVQMVADHETLNGSVNGAVASAICG